MKRIFLSLLPLLVYGQLLLGLLFTANAHANIGSSPAIDQLNRLVFARTVADNSELVIRDAANPAVDVLTKTITGRVFSSPVIGFDESVHTAGVDGGDIYVASLNGKLYKFDQNLNQVWVFDAGSAIYSTVALTPFTAGNAQLFFGNKDGHIISLNTLDGSKNWQVETGFEIGGNASLWPVDSSLVVANRAGEVLFLDQTTGAVNALYTHPDRASITTPALLANGEVVAATFNGEVFKLNSDGQEVWRFKFGEKFVAAPVVDKEGFIYVADYQTGDVISIYDRGLEKWRYNSGNPVYASLLLTSPDSEDVNAKDVDGHVVVADLAGNVIQLDKHTGQQMASQNTGANIYAAVNMANNDVITVNQSGNLSVINTTQHLANAQVAKFQIDSQNTGSHIDSDGDGYADSADAFPNDPNEWLDTDRDGIGNVADLNDDGDSCGDAVDTYPLDSTECLDTDGDLIGDNADLDDDNDGMSDVWEESYLPGSSKVAMVMSEDSDSDGLSNEEEFYLDTNPYSKDTDQDGLDDIVELNTLYCSSYDETFENCLSTTFANPLNPDSDGDGASDGFEVTMAESPFNYKGIKYSPLNVENQDPDEDGYNNALEEKLGTDPFRNQFDDKPFEFIEREYPGIGYMTLGWSRFSPDGKHLYRYSGSTNLFVSQVDLETGSLSSGVRIAIAPNYYSAEKAVFSKNGRFVLFNDLTENAFYVYERDLETGQLTSLVSYAELPLPSTSVDVFMADSEQGLENN